MNNHVVPFAIRDFVCRKEAYELPDDADIDQDMLGYVTGFGPNPRWVRVRTLDNKRKIWARENIYNVDFDCRDGNYVGTNPLPSPPGENDG